MFSLWQVIAHVRTLCAQQAEILEKREAEKAAENGPPAKRTRMTPDLDSDSEEEYGSILSRVAAAPRLDDVDKYLLMAENVKSKNLLQWWKEKVCLSNV